VVTYRIPSHTRVSLPPSTEGFVEEPFCVRLSGAEGGELTATLAYSRPKSSHCEVIAQKAYKAQEVNQGVAWAS
jgi:hypothetical protein